MARPSPNVPQGYIPFPKAAVSADLSDRARKLLLRLCEICWNGVEFVQSQPMTKAELAAACNVNRHVIGEQMPVLEQQGFAHLTPVLAGALFIVTIGSGNGVHGAIRATNGIVFSEPVGGSPEADPSIVTRGTIRANQRGLISLYTGNPPQVQEKEALDGTIRATHGIVFDAGWPGIFGALMAVGVYRNIALEIARSGTYSFDDIITHIRAWLAEGDRTGRGSLASRLMSGEPVPDVCPDCGHSRNGTHNFECETCAAFMRTEYKKWSTADDDDSEEV
jgi:hypothetical protein